MLHVLSGFPGNVLAVVGSGEITAADYRTVLEPAVLAKLKQHKHLDFYYELAPDFTISAGAMWHDAKVGIGHWSAWGRIAVVADSAWIRDSVRLFAPFFHHPVRVFATEDVAAARDWIAKGEAKAA